MSKWFNLDSDQYSHYYYDGNHHYYDHDHDPSLPASNPYRETSLPPPPRRQYYESPYPADPKPFHMSSRIPPMGIYEDDEAPDVITIRHRGQSATLQFPAYAIGDGLLMVGDVREAAADKLGVAPARRIKLLYKGRLLKDDGLRAKTVGLKQNSLVLCVVSEDFGSEGSTSEVSEPEQQHRHQHVPTGRRSGRPSRDRRARRRSDVYGDGHAGDDDGCNNGDNHSFRDPEILLDVPTSSLRPRRQRSPSAPREERARGLQPPTGGMPSRTDGRSPSRGPARSRSPHPHSYPSTAPEAPPRPSPSPRLTTAPSPDLHTAKTPREKIEILERYFLTVIKPACAEYIDNPPHDARARDFEYKCLGETAMTQLILKADEIDLEGDEAARMRRKALIDRVHRLLKDVDDAAKI